MSAPGKAMSPEVIYRIIKPATDQDWASPEFDYLQPFAATQSPEGIERTRSHRPYLIANIRANLGDPKWDPRGARVIPFP